MKKIVMLSAAVMMIVSTYAQSNDAALKQEIANMDKSKSVIKKEVRSEKKALRKLEGKDVSFMAKDAFQRDFGNIPVTSWQRTGNFDEATFIRDGKTVTAFYDYDAQLVGTTSNKAFEDLPASAKSFINKKYKDYNVEGVVFFDDNEFNETDMILYGHQFADQDNYFVELKKGDKKIVLQVNMEGDVSFFEQLK